MMIRTTIYTHCLYNPVYKKNPKTKHNTAALYAQMPQIPSSHLYGPFTIILADVAAGDPR